VTTLNANIRIIDIGSTDDTPNICRNYGLNVESHSLNENFAELRNNCLGSDWNLFIDPHEELVSGHDEINEIVRNKKKQSFYFSVVQGTILTKEIRLWNNGLQFRNPVYESIKDDGLISDFLILSQQGQIDLNQRFGLVDKWRKAQPISPDPYYYQALTHLLAGNYDKFVPLAKYYIEQEKKGMATIMLRYYLAMLQAYELEDFNEATRNLLLCLLEKPLMSEFWCLMGDIQYQIKDYQKAIDFYENAVILGTRRLKSDLWPMDISKYQDHPQKMITAAKKILNETKLYAPLNKA
jgi:tetratricopeptide (TPR) repeat protein